MKGRRNYRKIVQSPLLTAKQTRIARMLTAGHTQPEIARELRVSPSTVKTHVDRIRLRTGFDRHKHGVAFEIFLDRLLGQGTPPETRHFRGASVLECAVSQTDGDDVLRDAVLLLHLGFRDWSFHQGYRRGGAFVSEWMSRSGEIATVRAHRVVVVGGDVVHFARRPKQSAGGVARAR